MWAYIRLNVHDEVHFNNLRFFYSYLSNATFPNYRNLKLNILFLSYYPALHATK